MMICLFLLSSYNSKLDQRATTNRPDSSLSAVRSVTSFPTCPATANIDLPKCSAVFRSLRGILSSAFFSIEPGHLRTVWPFHFHLRLFIYISIFFCFLLSHRSLTDNFSGHLILRTRLTQRLAKFWTRLVVELLALHVSQTLLDLRYCRSLISFQWRYFVRP